MSYPREEWLVLDGMAPRFQVLKMEVLPIALVLAALLCSLVAGFVFAFAVVGMPGLKKLGDREFLRAFQAMDRVIQNNQPVFILVWLGSAVAIIAAAILGVWERPNQ